MPEAPAPQPVAFEDTALLEQCRRGDMQAFGPLVAKYQDRVFNVILRICQNPADAEELAQETFLKALEGIETFRGRSRPRPAALPAATDGRPTGMFCPSFDEGESR